MSKSKFQLAFEGPALDDGAIDVRDLAPALLSLGEVVQAANQAVNGKRAEARLMMEANEKGSFIADLAINVSFMSSVADLLDTISDNPDRVAAAKELIDLLLGSGKVVGGTLAGLYGVLTILKKLQGGKPESVHAQPNGTTQIITNGTALIADSRVIALLNDLPTRQAIERFGEKALSVKGVERVRLGANDAADHVEPLILVPGDKTALKVPEPEEATAVEESAEREALLKIVVVALQGDYVWRFSDGGEKPFSARIDDTEFVNAVSEAKFSFASGDILRCRILEKQSLEGGSLHKETVILKVLEHITAARQLRLL